MGNDGTIKIIIFAILGFFVIKTCTNVTKSDRQNTRYTQTTQRSSSWEKSPVDELIRDMGNKDNFSIILHDMDAENQNSSHPTYMHQYKVVIGYKDTVVAEITTWRSVSATFFEQNIDNMGMEIASKTNGKVTKEAAPAGYSNYVGNTQYGHWVQRDGGSFWEFYGKFAFMSSMFNLMTYPARMSYWNDYHRNYYGTGRGYYGPSGQRVYGTRSYTASSAGKNTSWGKKPSSFKSNVRSKVSRSSTTSKSRSYSSSKSYSGSSKSKTTRSSSRSYSGTTYRSRSGGYGK